MRSIFDASYDLDLAGSGSYTDGELQWSDPCARFHAEETHGNHTIEYRAFLDGPDEDGR